MNQLVPTCVLPGVFTHTVNNVDTNQFIMLQPGLSGQLCLYTHTHTHTVTHMDTHLSFSLQCNGHTHTHTNKQRAYERMNPSTSQSIDDRTDERTNGRKPYDVQLQPGTRSESADGV